MTDVNPDIPVQRSTLHSHRLRVALFVFGLAALLICGCNNQYGTVAVYNGFTLKGNPNFDELTADFEEIPSIAVYVQLSNQEGYLLSELPEEAASRVLKRLDRENDTMYYDDASILVYRNGKLIRVFLAGVSEKFRISAHKDGPYLPLDIDRETLIKNFGEPTEWRPATPPARSTWG